MDSVAFLFSFTHYVPAELYLFSLLFPDLLYLIGFVWFTRAQVGFLGAWWILRKHVCTSLNMQATVASKGYMLQRLPVLIRMHEIIFLFFPALCLYTEHYISLLCLFLFLFTSCLCLPSLLRSPCVFLSLPLSLPSRHTEVSKLMGN